MYTPVPGGEEKLAYYWANYEIAHCPGYGTAADAVIAKFWVMHNSLVSFIVDDTTVLTHASHCFLLCLIAAYL